MPFVNQAQARACWAAYSAAEKAGKTPAWDCHEWAAESPAWKDLPKTGKKSAKRGRSASKKTAGSKKRRSRSRSASPAKKVNRKVHTGPKGGKYIIQKGRKVYVK